MDRQERDRIQERNEKVKEWLWRYREAKKDVRRLEEELRELVELQRSISAVGYTDMPKGGCRQGDLSEYVVKQERAVKKVQKARYQRIVIFQEVKNVIERLSTADEREIISARYISGKPWESICAEHEYSWRTMHRIHSKALEEIFEFIKNGIDWHT